MRVTDNGNTVYRAWCQLGDVGLMRGSLLVDQTGLFDYKLVIVTASGYIYTIGFGETTCVNATLYGSTGVHLEGK